MKRIISIALVVIMILTVGPISSIKEIMEFLPNINLKDFTSFFASAEFDNSNENNSNEIYEDGWVYKSAAASGRFSINKAASTILKNEIEVTIKGTEKSSGKEVLIPGATVTLNVDNKVRSSVRDDDNDGVVKLSIASLKPEEFSKATVSAFKKVAEGKAMNGNARDTVYSNFKNSDDNIIRYEYELHSETIDDNGNWIGEKIKDGKKADIVFVIDATGSMSDEIRNVKNNIAFFSEKLINAGMDIRFSIVEYRDTTEGEETRVHTFSGSKWTSTLPSITSKLSSIYATGGGDSDETAIDALGAVAQSNMNWRSDAQKFAFLFTDAGYKTTNRFGYTSLSDLSKDLKAKGICTSVVTTSSNASKYSTLYNSTGGIYANLSSSSFSTSMSNLAEKILLSAKRKMELKLTEPRIKYNLTVCYLANNKASKSNEYLESMKNMIREYAKSISQTTDGHAFINKVYLFSTDKRVNFFDTNSEASMADIQIQTSEKDDGTWWNNVQVHSNAYVNGFYNDDVVSSKESIDAFQHLKKADSYKGKKNFYRIQLSAVEGAGWNNSFSKNSRAYASTVSHESGHYIFSFYDEYGYQGKDKEGNDTLLYWGTNGINRPGDRLFGLMDNQHDDIEMSNVSIDYNGLECLKNPTSTNSTVQFYLNNGSCEDTFAELLTESEESVNYNLGDYEATYSKVKTNHDRRASYSNGGNVTFVGGSSKSKSVGSVAKKTSLIKVNNTVDASYFDNMVSSKDRIADTSYSVEGNKVSFELTSQDGKEYSAYVHTNASEAYEELTLSSAGSKKSFAYELSENDVAEIVIVENGSQAKYFTYYVDTSESCDTGYIYNSVDKTTVAYENVKADAALIHISDGSSKTNGDYVSVNNSTYITADVPSNISDGEIYSVAACAADIDYSTLSWFVNKNGSWTKLSTDTSYEENNNIGARADTNGEGLYVLMAKKAQAENAKPLSNLTCTTDNTVNGRVVIDFTDDNSNTKYYNVYYCSAPFTSKNDDVLSAVCAAKDGTQIILNLSETNIRYYIAVEAVTETGAKSELVFESVTAKDADSDNDGIDDNYCDKYSLWGVDGEDKDIANSDDDFDGLTNLEEYKRGSDPKNPNDPVVTLPEPVKSISISKNQNKILINSSFKVSASILPVEATNQNITWETDNDSIVALTPDGSSCTVKGVGTGTANVYAVSNDGGYSAVCTVTVYCNHNYSSSWTVDKSATTLSDGSKSHHCKICSEKKDVTFIPRVSSVEQTNYSYFCDGTKKAPGIAVKDSKGSVLKKNRDYTLTYSSSSSSAVGSYNILVTFKGNYSGTRTVYYYIYDYVRNLRKTSYDLSGITLAWDKLAGVSGYKIMRKYSTDKTYKQIATTKLLEYTDKKISINKEYNYIIIPYNSKKTGANSSSVYYSTVIPTPNLSVYTSDTGELSTYVSRGANTVGYKLYRASSEKGKYSLIKSSAYAYCYDSGLTIGKKYYYKARAVAYVNEKAYYSDYSSIVSATVGIGKPSTLNAYSSGKNQITLNWDCVKNATGYDVYRCDSSYGSYIRIGSTKDIKYTDKSLSAEKRYYYKIVAYKTVSGKNFYGDMSCYASAYTEFSYPYNVSVTSKGLTTNTVKWIKPSDAKGVELSISENNSYDYKVLGEFTGSSYTHKKVDNSKYYYYRLRSYKVVDGKKLYSSYYFTSYKVLLPQVTGLKASNLSQTSVRLSWNKVSNASIYYIYRSTSIDGSYYIIGNTENTNYDVTDLTLDCRYYYKVEARRNVNGITNYGVVSRSVGIIVLVPAAKISSVKNVSSTSLSVSWKKVKDASYYNLYRSTKKDSGYILIKSGLTKTSFVDSKLKYGTTYYYKIKSVAKINAIDNISLYSSSVSKKVALVAPDVTANSTSLSSIKLAWNKDAGVNGYEIYKSTSKKGTYKKVKTIAKATSSYTDNNLKGGKTYYYKVRAYKLISNKKQYSPYSSVAFCKTSPTKVTSLKIVSIKTTGLTITWSKSKDAKFYKVEQYNPLAKKWIVIKTVTKNSIVVSKLKTGTIYKFRVTPLDSTKKISGKVSNTITVTTLCSAPRVNLATTSANTATASWSKVTGAKSYIIYKSTNNKKWTKVTSTEKTSYSLTKLEGGKKIYVKVCAVNASKLNSEYSSVRSVTVKK